MNLTSWFACMHNLITYLDCPLEQIQLYLKSRITPDTTFLSSASAPNQSPLAPYKKETERRNRVQHDLSVFGDELRVLASAWLGDVFVVGREATEVSITLEICEDCPKTMVRRTPPLALLLYHSEDEEIRTALEAEPKRVDEKKSNIYLDDHPYAKKFVRHIEMLGDHDIMGASFKGTSRIGHEYCSDLRHILLNPRIRSVNKPLKMYTNIENKCSILWKESDLGKVPMAHVTFKVQDQENVVGMSAVLVRTDTWVKCSESKYVEML
mmetsp:Transcript_13994/g.19244  ORF Transcript_13994/g.19244 Transcript_13994/m.19244 type:complete len:267 (-) Transcript_13994:61-861(-)